MCGAGNSTSRTGELESNKAVTGCDRLEPDRTTSQGNAQVDGGPDLVLDAGSEHGIPELSVGGLGIVLWFALFNLEKNANPAVIDQQEPECCKRKTATCTGLSWTRGRPTREKLGREGYGNGDGLRLSCAPGLNLNTDSHVAQPVHV